MKTVSTNLVLLLYMDFWLYCIALFNYSLYSTFRKNSLTCYHQRQTWFLFVSLPEFPLFLVQLFGNGGESGSATTVAGNEK